MNFGSEFRDRPRFGLTFPLHYLQAGWPMQLLFTYHEHWPTAP